MYCVLLTHIRFAGYLLVNASAMFKNTIKIVATVEKGICVRCNSVQSPL